jgi:hypothetical protein
MRRLTALVGLGCGLALLLFFYRAVLFQGEQFAFRDSAHYYYPLYHMVQAEWEAGRLPLWDPSENAGMPLLGNPTAAVLYPGKLIFAALPYPWAVRMYAVAHSALAFAGMIALMRSWGTSRVGSAIAALAFTFGGPVVFQYCNIIFLVGASWCPWGLLAIDRWLRLGRAWALPALAVVLAMQVLGGDPESAYLTGLSAVGYAVGLAWVGKHGPWRLQAWKWVPMVVVGLVAWVAFTLAMAAYLPGFRPEPGEKPWGPVLRWIETGRLPEFHQKAFEGPVPGIPQTALVHQVLMGAWGLAGLVLLVRWWRRGSSRVPLVPKLAGLLAAATLGGALSAAQVVPVAEFTGLTGRATDEGAHDIYPFSLEPYRLVEAIWPGIYGRSFGKAVTWGELLTPTLNHRVWTPSLYLGGFTAILALAAAGFRGGPPWRSWLTAIAAVSVIGSLGEFSSPLIVARYAPSLQESLGPHDKHDTNAVRLDGYLRDGDGSPYSVMSVVLPGFQQFRFPSKLLTFAALAVAGLAGLGWDGATLGGGSKKVIWLASLGLGVTLAVLASVFFARGHIIARLDSAKSMTLFGPLDAKACTLDIQFALIHGALVLAAIIGLLSLARRRAELAGVLALLVLSVDLALANSVYIKTAPQSDFEVVPKVVELIAQAERLDPSPGPYRVHRQPIWNPTNWQRAASSDRIRDFVHWENDTIQPKYGLLHGVQYTSTLGVAELYDYQWFFAPFPRAARADAARLLGVEPGYPVVVYPRRGFDLWNSRYFVLPGGPDWKSADRGYASFLPQTRLIYPPREFLSGRAEDPKVKHWLESEDFQVVRNLDAYPRAWVVHEARFKEPIAGLTRATRKEVMEEIVFGNDPFWHDTTRALYDPKRMAWVEVQDLDSLKGYLSNIPPQAGESVKVVVEESSPQRTVLEASLTRPGLVILAEVFYPGWKLTIDGQPAPIYRANRLMRAAAVKEGKHRLVYTYEPRSVQVGAAISLLGIVALLASTAWSLRRGRNWGKS